MCDGGGGDDSGSRSRQDVPVPRIDPKIVSIWRSCLTDTQPIRPLVSSCHCGRPRLACSWPFYCTCARGSSSSVSRSNTVALVESRKPAIRAARPRRLAGPNLNHSVSYAVLHDDPSGGAEI
nr:hypothetical protein CFP56_53667 [Quercus suber]